MWASPCISLSSAEDEPCRAGGRAGTTRGCCGSDADRACRDAVRVTQGCRWEHAGRGGGQGELAAAACPSVLRAQIKPQRAPQPAGSNGLTSCSSLLAALCLGWAPWGRQKGCSMRGFAPGLGTDPGRHTGKALWGAQQQGQGLVPSSSPQNRKVEKKLLRSSSPGFYATSP